VNKNCERLSAVCGRVCVELLVLGDVSRIRNTEFTFEFGTGTVDNWEQRRCMQLSATAIEGTSGRHADLLQHDAGEKCVIICVPRQMLL
jgi:hypothetical protein